MWFFSKSSGSAAAAKDSTAETNREAIPTPIYSQFSRTATPVSRDTTPGSRPASRAASIFKTKAVSIMKKDDMVSAKPQSNMAPTPKWLQVIRIAQLCVALAVVALCGYGVYWLKFNGDTLMLFAAVASVLITSFNTLASSSLPALHNHWALLTLELIGVLLWGAAFPLLATGVAEYSKATTYHCAYYWDGVCYYKDTTGAVKHATATVKVYRDCMTAAAALGGLEFVLFCITLVALARNLRRQRGAASGTVAGEKKLPLKSALKAPRS
ncbi:hypothetical protein BP5796_03712 [Coleophoma crateriformis]|uniref:MARVEL domain-containing protein n=1 Tax=Coleophoma crateriformis TaxID=565419 RepID=A0A3D8SGB4_9HELO|nr:hypothetical protein BP5796_03712 [Coleophoma crateriformis]